MPAVSTPVDLDLNGFLLVNKTSGPTSYDVIRWVKRACGRLKIGHSGTLDPLASGLLILLFGKATKQQAFFMGHDKTYRCQMRFGVRTDSGDITGRGLEHRPITVLAETDIRTVLSSFTGLQQQIPPMFSALKHEGTPLYKWARKGKTIDRKPRSITVHSIELLSKGRENDIEFRVTCSPGTYIRTLVEDIGRKCGTVATMVSLVREAIGPYRLETAIPAESIPSLSLDRFRELLTATDKKP